MFLFEWPGKGLRLNGQGTTNSSTTDKPALQSKKNYHEKLVKGRMSRRPAIIYATAFASSLITFLASYFSLVWILVRYKTWRLGHPNPFVIGPTMDAAMGALLVAVIVFWLVVKWAQENQ
jgi:hypothetical protein